MISSSNVIIFLACVLISGYRSYRKGVWCALLNLLGLLCAYIASFLLAPTASEFIKSLGVGSALAYLLALTFIFVGVTLVISVLPVLFFPKIKEISITHRISGASLGVVTGCVLAVILIWVSGFIKAAISPGGATEKPDVLSRISSTLVSQAATEGMRILDSDEQKTHVTAALLSEPQAVSSAFIELSKSGELQDLWLDGEFQFLMAEENISQMLVHEKFEHLVEKPSLQKLLALSKPKDISDEDTKRYLASKMSFLWRRMRVLRSDERAVAILEDPEFKALLEKQNPLALLTSKKAQSLMDIVLEEPSFTEDSRVSSSEPAARKAPKSIPPSNASTIYKWKNEKGETRYTDYEHTPAAKRQTAEKIVP